MTLGEKLKGAIHQINKKIRSEERRVIETDEARAESERLIEDLKRRKGALESLLPYWYMLSDQEIREKIEKHSIVDYDEIQLPKSMGGIHADN